MTDFDARSTELVQRIAAALTATSARIAVAESCTGGWIAKALTDQPGSSAWFGYGFITYSDEAKQALLGVSAETLALHGAVSAEVAEQMATGARLASGAVAARRSRWARCALPGRARACSSSAACGASAATAMPCAARASSPRWRVRWSS